ncbi:MAG: RluA family pseudouridine synthase [Pirellulales bacterium]
MRPTLDILYEEGPVLVLCKPGGLLTQAPPGIDSLETRIKHFIKRRDAKPGNVYLGVPHRLDRPVSGAIVFARHVRAARRLAEQFEARTVRKTYWACVEGQIDPPEGTWKDLIKKRPGEAHADVVNPSDPDGRQAVLHYKSLRHTGWGSLLEIELETGRMHQVRVQAASRGHPILGDAQYGASLPFGEPFEDTRLRSIALHARELAFQHPMTWEPVSIVAPLPEAWRAVEESIP